MKKKKISHGLKETNLEKILDISFLFIFGFSHFDGFLDRLLYLNFDRIWLLTFLMVVTNIFVIEAIKKSYRWMAYFTT